MYIYSLAAAYIYLYVCFCDAAAQVSPVVRQISTMLMFLLWPHILSKQCAASARAYAFMFRACVSINKMCTCAFRVTTTLDITGSETVYRLQGIHFYALR